MKLNKISLIQAGLVLSRKKAKTTVDTFKTYDLISLKSILEDGYICKDELEKFSSVEELDSRYLTSEGDILLRLTKPFTSVYITNEFENCVIPSNFVKIKVKSEEVLPQYLNLFLNSDLIKSKLNADSYGTVLSIIKIENLNNLHINLLDLQTQNKLIGLQDLHMREQLLLNEQLKEKQKFFKGIISKKLRD